MQTPNPTFLALQSALAGEYSMLAAAKAQLVRTVTALEQMRLELLRLQGGGADLRPLTTSLESARAMVEDLVRLREAEDEIGPRRRRPLAIDARSPSPA
jgi:transposase